MKITFQNPTDNNTESIEARRAQRGRSQGPGGAGRLSGVRIDLGGGERQFTGQAEAVSAFAQIQQAAGTVDAKTQQDYMTLMSNTMSEEDYKKLQKEGFSIRQMDLEEAVTILDKIKAEMARSGKKVAGYNDDLDRETLEAALGSQALALAVERNFLEADFPLTEETLSGIRNAWEMASALEELPDGAEFLGTSLSGEKRRSFHYGCKVLRTGGKLCQFYEGGQRHRPSDRDGLP